MTAEKPGPVAKAYGGRILPARCCATGRRCDDARLACERVDGQPIPGVQQAKIVNLVAEQACYVTDKRDSRPYCSFTTKAIPHKRF